MKKFLLLISVFFALGLQAQKYEYHPETVGMPEIEKKILPLAIVFNEADTSMPKIAVQQLKHKINQVFMINKIAPLDYLSQFFITANIVTNPKLEKEGMNSDDIIEVNMYIADYKNQKVITTTKFYVRAVGSDEAQRYTYALRQINPKTPDLARFLNEATKEILAYYDKETPNILKQANNLTSQKLYKEALSLIVTIPTECKYYNDAISAGLAIYQKYLDNNGDVNLAYARQVWVANKTIKGADEAAEFLAKIDTEAKCYTQAVDFCKLVKQQIGDEWKFEMKEAEPNKMSEKDKITEMRRIGVEQGKSAQFTANLDFVTK